MIEKKEVQWLQTILQHVPDAIIVLDRERMVRFANAAAARMAGESEATEIVGRSYPEILKHHRIFNEDGSPAIPSDFPSEIAFRRNETTHNAIFAHVDPTGVHHWLSVTSFPLEHSGSIVESVVTMYRDISHRKLKDDRLRFLIESAKILSISTDLKTRLREKTRLIVPSLADWATVNLVGEDGSMERLAVEHRDPAKLPLLERFTLLAAEHPKLELRSIYRVARTAVSELYPRLTPADLTSIYNTPEGRLLLETLKPCSAMIVPIRSNGRTLGVLSLAYSDSGRTFTQGDVEFMEEFGSHLSVTVDNARLYDEIAKRDAAKDRFLATLSHELRNPLAPIKSALELVRVKGIAPTLAPELKLIEHQFDHMEKLLRDLLDVTRFTLGKLTLSRTPVDFAVLVQTVSSTHRGSMEQNSIAFSVSVPQEPVWISADSVRIEQVLVNLLSNAQKFTSAGGRIAVSLKCVGHNAVLTVEDSGTGITHEDIGRVFDQYFQGKNPQQRSGLGMGLVLVRQIVELHGGSVGVKSEGEGMGATFTVSLPLDREHAHSMAEAERPESAPPSKDTVLIIDDNQDAADALAKLLSAIGYSASAAYAGKDGIERFVELRPQHVIIDIGMPGMNGYQVAQHLRSNEGANAHLIALSGYGLEEDKRKAKEAGFDQHLTKPVGLKDLQAVLASNTV